eukprot:TRINITY_DN2299_c0_g1_i1.p1 TRINITY_DN2299_c0_g1~~TRINITY_DN2299_c0_g1_i1.p1  ORF type:complete len:2212 (+),score=828.58 TRINITY_DN2299_c0_g1_i1:166-6801(+)
MGRISVEEYVRERGGNNPIRTILIANNGIAAVKAIRSIRKWAYETLGDERSIQFVVMATPEDLKVNAEYIRMADQVEEVPGGSNANNYANVDLIVEIAERRKVQAVWAGWGHASENPRLPDMLSKTADKIAFIGPPSKAMHDLGDKIASTLIAQSARVNCVAWNGSKIVVDYSKDGIPPEVYRSACVETLEEAMEAVKFIGYPAMIKASEGGGGKGIRKVTCEAEVESSLRQVQGEVPGSPIFIMQMLSDCRHLEVQVLADQYGEAIALYGRDCSVQRRHQKIIEEGPAIIAPKDVWQEMEAAATRMTKAVGYVGVGTVEYLYSPARNQYYFLELNPRLQVEHPVTELITDVNLPAAQLNVAMGIPLHSIPDIRRLYLEDAKGTSPINFETKERREPKGHVIAARITGENPAEGFKPTSGGIQELNFRSTAKVWGYFSVGALGGLHEYADSQFGHIFSHGDTREAARKELVIALKEISIRGDISTPVAYVAHLIETDTFKDNAVSTQWLDSLIAAAVQIEKAPDAWLVILCGALYKSYQLMSERKKQYVTFLSRGQVPAKDLLRNEDDLDLIYLNTKYSLRSVWTGPNSVILSVKSKETNTVEGEIRSLGDGGFLILLAGRSHICYGTDSSNGLKLVLNGKTCNFTSEYDPTKLKTTTAGKLVRHLVESGSQVKPGTAFAEIEVMKMYLPIIAQEAGRITFLKAEGTVLEAGAVIASLQLDDPSQVSKTQVYEGDLPLLPPPYRKGDKAHQILRSTLSTIYMILSGYHDPHYKDTVNLMLSQLMNPDVPLLETQECLSRISAKLPKGLLEQIQTFLEGYRNSVDMNPTDCTFNGKQLGKYVHNFVETVPAARKNEILSVSQPLLDIANRFGDGNEDNLRKTIISILKELWRIEAHFGPHREESIHQLRVEFKDNLEKVFEAEVSHHNIGTKAKMINFLFQSISSHHHKIEHEHGFLMRSSPKYLSSPGLRNSGSIRAISEGYKALEEFIPYIQPIAELSGPEHHNLSHLCRSILIRSKMPTFENRISAMEEELQIPEALSDLTQRSEAIFDVLCNLMVMHPGVAVRKSAAEVYIRRTYAAYEICNLEIIANENGQLKGHWNYIPTNADPDDALANRKEKTESGMSRVSSDDNLSEMNSQNEYHGFMQVFADPQQIFTELPSKILDDSAPKPAHSQVLKFFLMESPQEKWLSSDEQTVAKLEALMQEHIVKLQRAKVRRVTFAVVRYGHFPKYYTFRQRLSYREHLLYRHVEPPMAFHLELNRISNYDIQIVPTENHQIHIYYGEEKQKEGQPKPQNPHTCFFTHAAIRSGYRKIRGKNGEEEKQEGNDAVTLAENVLAEALTAIELASGSTGGNKTWNNHIFMRMVSPVDISADAIYSVVMGLADKYSVRLWRCKVGSVEVAGYVTVGGSNVLVRFMITNPTSHHFEIDAYRQVTDPLTGKETLKALFGPGIHNGKEPAAPFELPNSLQMKRHNAHLNNTVYVYDIPKVLEVALQSIWRKYSSEKEKATGKGAEWPERVVQSTELVVNSEGELVESKREAGNNDVGMIAWRLKLNTPEYPQGREIIVISNDISFQSGSFGVPEDVVFKKASELARKEKIPRIYVAANSGARIGLATEVQAKFRAEWIDPQVPSKGYKFLYLNDADYKELNREGKPQAVKATQVESDKWMITDVIGLKDGLGVENLQGSGMVAGETSLAYDETFTLTFVTGRTVGIGAYLVRLGQRTIQDKGPIILTGSSALNKVLGRNVYSSNVQLGGPQVMHANGISHIVVGDSLEGMSQILNWISYVPKSVGEALPIIDPIDPIDRSISFVPAKQPYDPRNMLAGTENLSSSEENKKEFISGFFDKGSFTETLAGWAKTVVTGRARLGGIPIGVIAVETRTVELIKPADPASLDSHEDIIQQAGQVWFPDSAYKTAQAIRDFNKGEGLPLMIFANWRGFSGGLRDLYQEILKFGSYIVDSLREFNQPIFVYIPPAGELRGGAWVVVDPTINPDMMEMYSDTNARGGILEPAGTVEIKYKTPDLIKTMHRLDDKLRELDSNLQKGEGNREEIQKQIKLRERDLMPTYERLSVTFADLQDTPGRMKAKGVIREVVPWAEARSYFYYRLKRRLGEESLKKKLVQANTQNLGSSKQSHSDLIATIKSWFSESAKGSSWEDDKAFISWMERESSSIEERIRKERLNSMTNQLMRLWKEEPGHIEAFFKGLKEQQ